ncbi:MAG: hypothetical protein K1X74_09910 [Pirellulales bacterium]|nr:hypothetical protein [Pirellulales bacterium]
MSSSSPQLAAPAVGQAADHQATERTLELARNGISSTAAGRLRPVRPWVESAWYPRPLQVAAALLAIAAGFYFVGTQSIYLAFGVFILLPAERVFQRHAAPIL